MNKDEEIEYYRKTLEEGMQLICNALGFETDRYDRDQADGECYLDCFRDAAEVIEMSGVKWDDGEAEFILPVKTKALTKSDDIESFVKDCYEQFQKLALPKGKFFSLKEWGEFVAIKASSLEIDPVPTRGQCDIILNLLGGNPDDVETTTEVYFALTEVLKIDYQAEAISNLSGNPIGEDI